MASLTWRSANNNFLFSLAWKEVMTIPSNSHFKKWRAGGWVFPFLIIPETHYGIFLINSFEIGVHLLLLNTALSILYIFSAHLKVDDWLSRSTVFYFDFLQNMYCTFLVLFWCVGCGLYEISVSRIFLVFVYSLQNNRLYLVHSHYSIRCYVSYMYT